MRFPDSPIAFRSLVILVISLSCYAYFAYEFNFIQDDAYISYRYVDNYINGQGLVYNIGERIEGFTNFGWVIYLLFMAGLGLNFITVSKLTGAVLGAGVIVITFRLSRMMFTEREWLTVALVTMLVGINQSLAYWSPAGLEITAFAFLTALALYQFLRRSKWLLLTITWAVWVRPEGALLAGLLILMEVVQTRRFPKFTAGLSFLAFLLSIPFVVFKIAYYGSVLPNPFFAKTGVSLSQLSNGLEYAGRFLGHYGFWGVPLCLSLVMFRKITRSAQAVLVFTLLYTSYIVLVGGDVLKVHRFFLPIIPGFALLVGFALIAATANLSFRSKRSIITLIAIVSIVLTVLIPQEYVTFNKNEIDHTRQMKFLAGKMKASDTTDFSVAISTIGIFGYELIGHDIIDLLGLTDSTIARHSNKASMSLHSTWKEGKHNSGYVLSREPDYIVFSTGLKPSAPAEQSLLQYPAFLSGYKSIAWLYHPPDNSAAAEMHPAFKRIDSIKGELKPSYPIEWVTAYKQGLEFEASEQYRSALLEFQNAYDLSPEPLYSYLVYHMAESYLRLKDYESAKVLLDTLVAYDSLVYEAHRDLYQFARFDGDSLKAEIHIGWLKKLVPWHAPEVKEMVDRRVANRAQSR